MKSNEPHIDGEIANLTSDGCIKECILKCRTDPERTYCVSCGRTVEEIKEAGINRVKKEEGS